jgi:hypothetical protein
MILYQRLLVVLLAILTMSPAAVLHAADDVLSVIPENALGFVVVRNARHTSDKIADLTEKLNVTTPNLLASVQSLTGLAEGVSFDGDVALALVTDRADGDAPVPVLILPVSDFDAFVKSLNGVKADDGIYMMTLARKPCVAILKGDFAVIAEASNQAILKVIASNTTGVSSQLESIASWTRKTDVFVVGLPRGIAMVQRGILSGLAVLKLQIKQQGQQGETAITGLEIYEQLFGAADREIALIAAAVRLNDTGDIHLLSRTIPKPDGVLTRLSANDKPVEGDLFRGIPPGKFVIAAGGVYPASVMKDMTDWSMQIIKSWPGTPLNEQQASEFTALVLKSVQGLQGMSMSMRVSAEGEPLYGNMVLALHVDDADAYMETYQTTIEKMVEIGRDSGSPFFDYEVSRFDVNGLQGLQLTMDMDAMIALQPGPQGPQKAMMRAMFGEDGKMRIYLASADKNTILGTYVSAQHLVSAVADLRSGMASFSRMPDVEKVHGLLPTDATMVGYWSIGETVNFLRATLKSAVFNLSVAIPDFPETLPIGMAVSISDGGIESDMVVPFDVSKTIADFVRAIRGQETPSRE